MRQAEVQAQKIIFDNNVGTRGFAHMWIDGGCRPTNPGPAAMACIIDLCNERHKLGRPLGIKTNNQAEYIALYVGIKYAIHLGANGIEIYTDSQLIMNQMRYQWHVTEPTLIELRHLCRAYLDGYFKKNWELLWIPREENKEADALCTESIICNNPWVPNFNDPFRPVKRQPWERGIRAEASLP